MGIRDLVNPVSTAPTEWWCHSAVRNLLIGNELAAHLDRHWGNTHSAVTASSRARQGHPRHLNGTSDAPIEGL